MTLSRQAGFSRQTADLIRSAAGSRHAAVERSIEYLNWRYCRRPSGRAAIIELQRGGIPIGCAVVRARRRAGRLDGFIYEIACIPEPAAADALIAAAEELLRGCGAVSLYCVLPDDQWLSDRFTSRGYKRCVSEQYRPAVLILEKSPEADALRQSASWYLTLGDTDW